MPYEEAPADTTGRIAWACPASLVELLEGKQKLRSTANEPAGRVVRPLREGEVMAAYMDFDRSAANAFSPAEYLVQFGLLVSRLTVDRSGFAVEQISVRDAAAGWGAVDADGSYSGGGCSLEGWLRAVRWTEAMHGIQAAASCPSPDCARTCEDGCNGCDACTDFAG